MHALRISLLVSALGAGCGTEVTVTDDTGDTSAQDQRPDAVPLVAATPFAGAAEGVLELPVGTPLAGFTSRCGCLGGTSKKDDRDSAYSKAFVESTGVHIRPTIKAIWIESGDNHLVITKTDSIYSYDGLVEEVTRRLEDLTGEELDGMVTHTANHNHSSYGTYSKHTGLFLGHDKYNQENFERMASQVTAVAYEAWESRTEAKLGIGITTDWDPDNKVYSDRRGINDELVLFDDMGPEQGGKDPHLMVLRVDDAADDSPIAIMMQWGMHPFVFGESMSMATADATALVEAEVAESFDERVVAMFVQGSGGDASIRGSDRGWARMETVGLYARDAILDLWEDTEVSGDPITLETTHKAIPVRREDVRVTRDGTVDWYFPPFEGLNEDFQPDGEVFDENGDLISPLDEFHTREGAVFCGSGDFDLPVGGFNTEADPYGTCMQVEFMSILLETFFRLDEEQMAFPLDGMAQTHSAASMLGGVPVLRADGTQVTTDFLIGFVPGEAVHFFSEMWRHRVRDELGIEDTMLVAYAMDHYGYLLPMEDWILGEYEADITFWGPIGGDHVLEQLLLHAKAELLTTDLDEAWWGPDSSYGVYDDWPLETDAPDMAADAGTRLTDETLPEYFWVPRDVEVDLEIPATVPRLSRPLQLAWIGGDPGVDDPSVTLERCDADCDEEDSWSAVTSHTGRVINEDHHDFALAHTPDPLFPATAEQTHYWWATWQPVGHIRDRAGLPAGLYRLKVEGETYAGGNTTWPWDSTPYTFSSDPFEVVPAPVSITPADGGAWLSLKASTKGFRLVDLEGQSNGDNPLRGDLSLTWNLQNQGVVTETLAAGAPQSARTWLPFPGDDTVVGVTVADAYGNTGTWGSMPLAEGPGDTGAVR